MWRIAKKWVCHIYVSNMGHIYVTYMLHIYINGTYMHHIWHIYDFFSRVDICGELIIERIGYPHQHGLFELDTSRG